jgi:hypothetical protein
LRKALRLPPPRAKCWKVPPCSRHRVHVKRQHGVTPPQIFPDLRALGYTAGTEGGTIAFGVKEKSGPPRRLVGRSIAPGESQVPGYRRNENNPSYLESFSSRRLFLTLKAPDTPLAVMEAI